MRNRWVGALAVGATGALAWAGCALVIDLGPEAQLRTDASVLPGAPDAAPDVVVDAPVEAGPTNVCGLGDSPNPTCAACIQAHCCDVSKTCAADPECAAGLECIKDCMAQIECIITCIGNANLDKTTQCSQQQCPVCTPPDECGKLGQCCLATYDHGEAGAGQKILRDVCRGVILEVDNATCAQHLDTVKARSEAAPICNGQVPEAGSD